MRTNFFGEIYFEPTDDSTLIMAAVEDNFGRVPDLNTAEVTLFAEADEVYGFGGEFMFEGIEEPVGFDGFETEEEMRTWLEDLGVLARNIRTMA